MFSSTSNSKPPATRPAAKVQNHYSGIIDWCGKQGFISRKFAVHWRSHFRPIATRFGGSHAELKVIGVVCLLLLSCEFTVRSFGWRLSRDLEHLRNIATLSQQLAKQPGYRILFLGNSTTREDVTVEVLQPQLEQHLKRPLKIARIFPDDTTIAEWYYLFKHHFVDTNCLPDLLVLSFVYNYQLRDRDTLKTEVIASHFSNWQDIPQIFSADVPDFERRIGFLSAKVSAMVANRERVRLRLLNQLIPNYPAWASQENKSRNQAQLTSDAAATYRRLEQLLTLARKGGVTVLVVAMPTSGGYQLDPQIQTHIEHAGSKLLDLRNVKGLLPLHYRDNLHLNSAGAQVYSQFLAEQLKQHLPTSGLLPTQN